MEVAARDRLKREAGLAERRRQLLSRNLLWQRVALVVAVSKLSLLPSTAGVELAVNAQQQRVLPPRRDL
eukprot:SAG11_NODE_8542_length_1003_cov_1.146018_2_plen_68_part_01